MFFEQVDPADDIGDGQTGCLCRWEVAVEV